MTIPEFSTPALITIAVGFATFTASVITKVLTWRGQMLDNSIKSLELQQKLEAQASKQQLQKVQTLGSQSTGKTEKLKRRQRNADFFLDVIAVGSMALFFWQAFQAGPVTRGSLAMMIGAATVLLITLILSVLAVIINWQRMMNDRITLVLQSILVDRLSKRD
jgi:hypothetical protein